MKRALLLSMLLAPLLALGLPATASAQARDGVDVNGLVPAGLAVMDVVVSDVAGAPLRIALAPPGQTRAALVVDVAVAPDAARARAAFDHWRRLLQVEPPTVGHVGDSAEGDRDVAALVRDNVFVAVRRVAGGTSALSELRRADAAILAAPAHGLRGPVFRMPRSSGAPIGTPVRLSIPGAPYATFLTATGDATVRRTPAGWVLTRTGQGAFQVLGIGCDRRLRCAPVR